MNKPAENIFDVPPSISVAWAPFQAKLAAALAELQEDECLILSVKNASKVVQFAAQGAFGMRAETLSNTYMQKDNQLSEEQVSSLIDLGWLSPTKPESDPNNDPDGSPNYYTEFKPPVSFVALAELAVRTFIEILNVSHPARLQYYSFDIANGEELEIPSLGLKLADRSPQGDTSHLLLEAIKAATRITDLAYDGDGDIGVRFNSAYLYVRLANERKNVRMFSVILRNVRESHGLYVRLNDMNSKDTLVRFIFRNGTVVCTAEIRATPLITAQFDEAFWWFSKVADDMGKLLQIEFGGQVAFPEAVQRIVLH